jgi:hypothetical protein
LPLVRERGIVEVRPPTVLALVLVGRHSRQAVHGPLREVLRGNSEILIRVFLLSAFFQLDLFLIPHDNQKEFIGLDLTKKKVKKGKEGADFRRVATVAQSG